MHDQVFSFNQFLSRSSSLGINLVDFLHLKKFIVGTSVIVSGYEQQRLPIGCHMSRGLYLNFSRKSYLALDWSNKSKENFVKRFMLL